MIRRDWLEDEGNSERWMVSYADFITLLFAFFVVMYAISSVNDEKYRVLSDTLAEAFNVDAASIDPIQVGEPALVSSPHVVDLPDATAFADQAEGDTQMQTQNTELETALGGFAEDAGISLHSTNDWLELSINSDVLFGSGAARLSEDAVELLSQTAETVLSTNNPITIEGYTDNVDANSTLYPSNWELSAARASAVARLFVESGVRANRISAVGYGENHPVATNATPGGRAQNRRVVVVLARDVQTARNRNTTTAVAVIQGRQAPALDEGVTQTRKEDGGLLFTAEPTN